MIIDAGGRDAQRASEQARALVAAYVQDGLPGFKAALNDTLQEIKSDSPDENVFGFIHLCGALTNLCWTALEMAPDGAEAAMQRLFEAHEQAQIGWATFPRPEPPTKRSTPTPWS